MVKVDLIKFEEDVREDIKFLELFVKEEYREGVSGVLTSIRTREIEREQLIELYRLGVTCKELGVLTGRAFQSVYRTVQTYGEKDITRKNRENRKGWVWLVKQFYIVYLSDKVGSYRFIETEYGLSKRRAREEYKTLGGEKLIRIEEEERLNLVITVKGYYKEGYTGNEIANKMGIPVSTVYYYLKL